MNANQIFILVAVLTLVAVLVLWFFAIRPHGPRPLSPLSGIAFAFVIAGIVLGDQPHWLGYGLIAIGVVAAIADMIVHRPGRSV